MARVLLIDDNTELVGLNARYLCFEGFEVATAGDGIVGMDMALSGNFDIAVLDVMMPEQNGIETLRRIRASSDLPVIMLTACDDETDCIIGLELGADDYLQKPCSPRELAARLRAVLRRLQARTNNHHPVNSPLVVGPLSIWQKLRQAHWGGTPLELTSMEFSLLEILALKAGRPVSKTELSERGLGRPLVRFDRSIDVHISSLRHKIGVMPNGRPYIETVHRVGYQLLVE